MQRWGEAEPLPDVGQPAGVRAPGTGSARGSLPAGDEAEPLVEAHEAYFASRDPAIREVLLTRYQGLAYALANRYAKRPEDAEELSQVALLGLLRAIDRFDPGRGVQFSTFAWATLRGEIKRYYRNHSWALRVSRGLQERYLVVAAAVDELAHELHRSPTYVELATYTGLSVDEVAEAIEVRHAHRIGSIDAPVRPDSDDGMSVGAEDPEIDSVDDRGALAPLIGRLPPRQQKILLLRFVDELTQAEIATRVGLSQMHVSRLLAQSLRQLRLWAAESDLEWVLHRGGAKSTAEMAESASG